MALRQAGFGVGGNVIALGIKFILGFKEGTPFLYTTARLGLTPANFCAILQWWNIHSTIVK